MEEQLDQRRTAHRHILDTRHQLSPWAATHRELRAMADGLRVEYPDGFGLARPSNTPPVVVIRFEADTEKALARIQADFRKAILAVKPGAQLPF